MTNDGAMHTVEEWDLVIAHPPCTFFSCAGMVNLGRKNCKCATKEWRERFFENRTKAAIFFMSFFEPPLKHLAIENTIGYMNTHFRKPDQIIEPYFFGDPWKKATCLWLRGLPVLEKTHIVEPTGKWVQQNKKGRPQKSESWEVIGTNKQKERSKTFPGVARAMADQWGAFVEKELEKENERPKMF